MTPLRDIVESDEVFLFYCGVRVSGKVKVISTNGEGITVEGYGYIPYLNFESYLSPSMIIVASEYLTSTASDIQNLRNPL